MATSSIRSRRGTHATGAGGAGVRADGAAGEPPRPRLAECEQEAEDAPALRVAVLDSDSGFLVVLAKRMERLGWKHRVLSPKVTTRTLGSLQADALILDLALLGANRWTRLARLCEQRPDLRVIVCTGESTVAERVCALRLGADDWLAKPCHPEELIARVEAVTSTRRQPEVRDLEPMTMGEVEVRPDLYQAFVRGRNLRLTRREYQLIELLSRAGHEVQPREVIYECLWGYTMARNDRSVDVFVHKLRRKLERASPGWRYIHTHFGIGYRLSAEPVEPAGEGELLFAHEPAAAEPLAA
jgi:DNA-binding response OmpR family regulator